MATLSLGDVSRAAKEPLRRLYKALVVGHSIRECDSSMIVKLCNLREASFEALLGDVSHGSGAIQPPQVGGTSSRSPGDHVTNVAVMSPRSTGAGSSRGIIHMSINKQSYSHT